MKQRQPTPIDEAFTARGLTTTEVATSMGVSHQCVLYWRTGRNRIDPADAKELNRKFGFPLHVLRPDIWDPPNRAA